MENEESSFHNIFYIKKSQFFHVFNMRKLAFNKLYNGQICPFVNYILLPDIPYKKGNSKVTKIYVESPFGNRKRFDNFYLLKVA